jgi:hypothetical protein
LRVVEIATMTMALSRGIGKSQDETNLLRNLHQCAGHGRRFQSSGDKQIAEADTARGPG